jgi:hypothetical protein
LASSSAPTRRFREAVEQTRIVTANESTLFELLTLFRLFGALNTLGWGCIVSASSADT